MESTVTIYCFLEEILKSKGMSMPQLAKDLNISRGTVWKLANDPHYNPSKELLEKVCRKLGIDIGELLSLKKSKRDR